MNWLIIAVGVLIILLLVKIAVKTVKFLLVIALIALIFNWLWSLHLIR